jgi:hypothetical protein
VPRADAWKLSQTYAMPDISCGGATRCALISGGSRTAPTDAMMKSWDLRQFPWVCPYRTLDRGVGRPLTATAVEHRRARPALPS